MRAWRISRSPVRQRAVATFFSSSRHASGKDEPGVFGLKGLHRPQDWEQVGQSCIDDCLHLAENIRAQRGIASVSVLQTFDDLSDRLCGVLDVAELCRNVHPDPEFVEAANAAFLNVSSVIQHLNADKSLYEPLRELYDIHEQKTRRGIRGEQELSEEDIIMVKSLKQDFERGGINLNPGEKRKLIRLQTETAVSSSEFLSTPANSSAQLQIPYDKVRILPKSFLSSLRRAPGANDQVLVPLDSSNMQVLLKWVPDSRIRERAFRLVHEQDSANKQKYLEDIIKNRWEIANLLGYRSYAELLFEGRVASSPPDVREFLERLSVLVRNTALSERTSLEMEKLRRESHLAEDCRIRLHAWDRSFYIGKLKAENFDISSTQISQYFPLSACISGLARILHSSFGVRLERCEANRGESWHSDVQKLLLYDDEGEILGQVFLDLYPREGKYVHAAHFSMVCGRQPSNSANYQTATVALVCNFRRDDASGECLLSISDYETFFHEFGHSLHSIFSRTKYQHLSGTRVATDAVEVPSHVLEHFAWHPLVISKFARHYKSGDPMPTKLIRSLCASRNGFISTDIQMQLLFSAMDLEFHGRDPPIGSTTQAFETLMKQLTVYEPENGVSIPTTFHHIAGYGAGYYTYIFARVLSAQIWASLFRNDPFSREGGMMLRNGLLACGGACDPAVLLRNIIGDEMTCDAFLQNLGISSEDAQFKLQLPISRSICS